MLEAARTESGRVLAEARAEIERERERVRAATRRECESMLRDAESKHGQLSREISAMSEVHTVQDSVVKLDVGGRVFSTSVHTLRSVPHSMLDAMVSGRFEMKNGGGLPVHRPGWVPVWPRPPLAPRPGGRCRRLGCHNSSSAQARVLLLWARDGAGGGAALGICGGRQG